MNAKITTHLCGATFLALANLLAPPAWASERQVLRGHVPVAASRLQPIGRLPASSRLNLAIGLPLNSQDALTRLLEQLYDPANPQYRRYLTPEQFAERFGPTKEDYHAARAWAEAQGLVVTATHPNRTLLDVSGSVQDIERAFRVTLRVYQHPAEARTFHAPDVEPTLDLGVPVLHISGLNDFSRPRSSVHRLSPSLAGLGAASGGSAPGGGFLGSDFRAAYVPSVTLTGTGQSVALVEFDGYFPSDITEYESLAGLPGVPLKNVLIDGFNGSAGDGNSEVALDIEMAIAMAPGLSQVIVYEEANDGSPVEDILNRIAADNLARQISCSWFGFGEFGDPVATSQIFQQYAAQGQSFFEISGDFDAYPCSYLATSYGTPNGVAPPTDNPYVTLVGGTELNTSGPGGAWISESVWNLGYFPSVGYSVGSSGGISPTYPIPNWQQGMDMGANHGSTSHRNLPDVAMVADNVWVVANNGLGFPAWGTSASAPLWAGFTALANQLAEAHGQPPVGFINPAIYALGRGANYGAAFHDITTGNNNSSSSATGFPAVPGYDLCTGWGTPAGSNLLYALALPQFLQITPAAGFTGGGPVGGPFLRLSPPGPGTQTYSLTNSGAVSLGWSVGSSVSWLAASPASGTLAPGGSATPVTANLNSAANSLPLGTHLADIRFTNSNDGSVQSRLYTLVVQPNPQTPPIVVTQTLNQAVLDGGTAIFMVQVTPESQPVAYQWVKDGLILSDGDRISGATTGTLIISNVTAADVGNYNVFVANSIGVYFGYPSVLIVESPPVIVTPAASQAVLPGGTATFAVGAIGTKPFSYRWQNNGTNIASGGDTNVLTVRDVSAAKAGAYSVVVSNALGAVTNTGALLALIPITPPGVALTTVYSFAGGSEGANPNGLVQATNGNLYGTTVSGGTNHVGTVFAITTTGALNTLQAFIGGNDGSWPSTGLMQADDGYLYGLTSAGGANSGGTVFRLSVGGTLTTVHAFDYNEGVSPAGGLIQATDRLFYGTTSSGGSSGSGTVFRMNSSGALTSLHDFSGADGATPPAGLVQAKDGNLYGVTKGGGVNAYDGTVFRITRGGTLTTLAEFNATNSAGPRAGLVQGADGNFYGTTYRGGLYGRGTVFRVTQTGQLTILHSFNGSGDGQWPLSTLIRGRDGSFYGTTGYGGSGFNGSEFSGLGTVFTITPDGHLTTLVYFDGYNGANPSAALVQAADGTFYGTTLNGGANGDGTIFRFSAPPLTLAIAVSGSGVILSWPAWASDLRLQQVSNLTAGNWTAVTNPPAVTNLLNQVVLSPAPNNTTFYRLMH